MGDSMDRLDSACARLDALTDRLDARERRDAVESVNQARADDWSPEARKDAAEAREKNGKVSHQTASALRTKGAF